MGKTTLYFDELTIGDLMALVGTNICDGKVKYLVHGTNLRAMWNQLIKNENDYEFACDAIDITTEPEVTQDMIDAVKEFLDKDSLNDEDIKIRLSREFSSYLKKQDEIDKDRKFEIFAQALFDKIKQTTEGMDITIARKRIRRKKSKK